MDKRAIFHQSDSNYSFPIDKTAIKVRLRTAKNDSDIKKIEVLYNVSVLFYNEYKTIEMQLMFSDDLFSYYQAVLRLCDPRIAYVFKIYTESEGALFYSEDGFTKTYDFSFNYLNSFRISYINENDISAKKSRFKKGVFYQIFPERFKQGDFNKDQRYINKSWYDKKLTGTNNNRKQDAFIGGDLKGILNELEYLKDLGVGTIYLTPIYKSPSNHKYDIMDYYAIDPMFGDDNVFKELVDKCHKFNINIMLDLVFNHTSNEHPMFLDAMEKGEKSEYFDYYFIHDKPINGKLNYETFGYEVITMPKLNSNNFKEQEYFVNVGKYFIQKFNVDGYRLDVANEVSHSFWLNFKRKLQEVDKDIFLIGECWENASSYLGRNQLDSVMNYQFMHSSKKYFVTKELTTEEYVAWLNKLLIRYDDNTNYSMLNLLDSHDVERFYELVKPNKNIYLSAFLMLISYVGLPMIYYGDEIFMEGGQDPLNRNGMERDSNNFNSQEFKLFKNIIRLRQLKEFYEGEMNLSSENDMIKVERFIKDKYIIFINGANESKSLKAKGEVYLSNLYHDEILEKDGFVVFKK